MTLYRALFALFLALTGLLIPAIPSAPAQAAGCTTVWLTNPSYYEHFEAGTRRCVWLDDKDGGYIRIYRMDNREFRVVDWIDGHTKIAPNNGLYKPNADLARAFAAKYDVKLQFSVSNVQGLAGCPGLWAGVNGTYSPSGRVPGQGLVRIGTGTTSECMRVREEVMNTVRHEVAHALTERKCPQIFFETRYENMTDAYAWRFLGATTRSPGNYGFTRTDLVRAWEVRRGEC